MPVLLAIAIGGALGSLGRFGVAEWMASWGTGAWPMETFAVNVLGALAIGAVAAWPRLASGPTWLRPFLITGVLGGFTTVSAFALQTGLLLDDGDVVLALTYVVATLVVGLLAVRLGTVLVRRSTP